MVTAKDKFLQESLDVALLSKNEFDGEMLELTDKLVSTSGVYFERAKEQFSFFYPKLDIIKLDFLKVIYD